MGNNQQGIHKTAALQNDPSIGFTSSEDEISIDKLPVIGKMPSWLTGTLVRNGPAKFETKKQQMNHWFDGFAMLHKFSFAQGSVSYANRFLQSRAYTRAEETGKVSYSEFATDPCRSIFKRVTSLFSSQFTDNANVNVTRIANKFIAMTETPIAIEFDPKTLQTVSILDYDTAKNDATAKDEIIDGQLTTAHPHYDFDRSEMLNYTTKFRKESSYNIYKTTSSGTSRKKVASLAVREPAYMHSFGITSHYLILAEFPLIAKPLEILLSGKPFAENLHWLPERGTKFLVVDRINGGVVAQAEANPFFAFHHLNAFENAGGEIILDIVAYPDASIIRSTYLDVLRGNKPLPAFSASQLRRYRIPTRGSARAEYEVLYRNSLELPRIDYERYNTKKDYRFVYAVAGYANTGYANELIKIDLEQKGHSDIWSEKGCFPGEPVFVSRPGENKWMME